MNDFSPAAVRKSLDRLGAPCPINKKDYGELCELVTHPTPDTKPNKHDQSDDKLGYVGGSSSDEVGYKKSFDTLLLYCSLSSIVVSKIFGLESNVQKLADLGKDIFSD